MIECRTPNERDLTRRKLPRFVLWQLPAVALLAGVFVNSTWRTILWTAALAVAGGACVANVSRSGRLHCYVTGLFYLLGAAVTLAYGLGVLPLGPNGWAWIGLGLAVGSVVLVYLPERIWSKYVTRETRTGDSV